jgi:hypothetical protein
MVVEECLVRTDSQQLAMSVLTWARRNEWTGNMEFSRIGRSAFHFLC